MAVLRMTCPEELLFEDVTWNAVDKPFVLS